MPEGTYNRLVGADDQGNLAPVVLNKLKTLFASSADAYTQIAQSGYDLNTLNTHGKKYIVTTNSTANTLINCPVKVAFKLEVVAVSSFIWQVITTYSSTVQNKVDLPEIWIRRAYSGTWGAWYRLATSSEVSTTVAAHTHIIADITGLQAALDAKANTTDVDATNLRTKLMTVDGAGSGIDADLLDGKHASSFSLTTHNHDDRYYTEAEIDSKLTAISGGGGVADWSTITNKPVFGTASSMDSTAFATSGHLHDDRYYTETEIDSRLSSYVARNYQENSITPAKVVISMPENLFPNGDLFSKTVDPFPSGLTLDTTDVPPGHTAAIKCGAGGAGGGFKSGYDFPVIAGQPYAFEAWVKADTADSVIYLELRDADTGAHGGNTVGKALRVGDTPVISGPYLLNQQKVPTTWTRFTGIWTPNAGVHRAKLGSIYFNHSSGTNRNAVVSIGGMYLRPMMRAELTPEATTSSSGLLSASNKADIDRLVAVKNATTTADGYMSKDDKTFLEKSSIDSGWRQINPPKLWDVNTTGGSAIRFRRYGNLVQVRGGFNGNPSQAGTIAVLPAEARPTVVRGQIDGVAYGSCGGTAPVALDANTGTVDFNLNYAVGTIAHGYWRVILDYFVEG